MSIHTIGDHLEDLAAKVEACRIANNNRKSDILETITAAQDENALQRHHLMELFFRYINKNF